MDDAEASNAESGKDSIRATGSKNDRRMERDSIMMKDKLGSIGNEDLKQQLPSSTRDTALESVLLAFWSFSALL